MDHNIEQTLRSFIGEWGKSFQAIVQAFERHLAANCVWVQGPIPTTRTLEQALTLLRGFRDKVGLETFPAEIRNLAVNGRVAFVERVDHLRRADGSIIASAPVTGVLEFDDDGRIVHWREYFDSAPVIAAMEQAGGGK